MSEKRRKGKERKEKVSLSLVNQSFIAQIATSRRGETGEASQLSALHCLCTYGEKKKKKWALA